MSCIPCFSSQGKKAARRTNSRRDAPIINSSPPKPPAQTQPQPLQPAETRRPNNTTEVKNDKDAYTNNIKAQTFTFRELASATKNFRQECLIGEGGFGRVYKGHLDKTGQVVAVKQLDRNGLQGNKEFLVEVLMLSLLHHPHLVNLTGYCADGDQRLLVYEYMPLGSLEDHLLDPPLGQKPLDWYTRMKVALGAAKGLEYLHDKANPPVIYRDLKSSNILLGPCGDKTHVSSRVMGTYGYCAPEYQRTGHLTVKSDVYSFGVVLLELITGRRAIDTTRPNEEQNLVAWAYPVFRDRKRYPELADPRLEGNFPENGLNQAVAIASMCLQEEETTRPFMSDVVTALSFLSEDPDGTKMPPVTSESSPSQNNHTMGNNSKVYPDDDSTQDREQAVAEAMEWGSHSRQNMNSSLL